MSRLKSLIKAQRVLPPPPPFVYDNLLYETIMGSEAYGVADTSQNSDTDIHGFCMPPKDYIFPHLSGKIDGFGSAPSESDKNFASGVWQRHHVFDEHGHEFDFCIYGIVRYFQLTMECNPNMIDSLFTSERCVTYMSPVAQMVREKRKIFLSKKAFHTFKGYAYQQIHKMDIKKPEPGSKRAAGVEKYGYDLKFAYHVVRLLDECRQILVEHDLNLERNSEQLKSIRRGEWTKEQIFQHFDDQKASLETLYNESKLQHSPDEQAIKQLLVDCLEAHFGTLGGAALVMPGRAESTLREIDDLLARYKSQTGG